jgi:hypothetical protein
MSPFWPNPTRSICRAAYGARAYRSLCRSIGRFQEQYRSGADPGGKFALAFFCSDLYFHKMMMLTLTSLEPTLVTPVSIRYGFRVGESHRWRGSVLWS